MAGLVLVAFLGLVAGSGLALPVPARQILEEPGLPMALFLMVAVGESLLVPGFLALHFRMRENAAGPTLAAVAFVIVSAALFVVARLSIVGLALMSETYLAASDSEQVAYLASATVTAKIQDAISTGALLLLCVASLLAGVGMLSGAFPRWLAWTTIAAACTTTVSPFAVQLGLPLIIPFIGLFLTAVWQCTAGGLMFRRPATR
jgi:hypothetical protein